MIQGETKLKGDLLTQVATLEPGARVQIKAATFDWQTPLVGLTGTVVKCASSLVYVDLKHANHGILNGFKAEHLALQAAPL